MKNLEQISYDRHVMFSQQSLLLLLYYTVYNLIDVNGGHIHLRLRYGYIKAKFNATSQTKRMIMNLLSVLPLNSRHTKSSENTIGHAILTPKTCFSFSFTKVSPKLLYGLQCRLVHTASS